MILYPDCDYYHERKDDPFAPDGECETCYRYDICKKAYDKEHPKLSSPLNKYMSENSIEHYCGIPNNDEIMDIIGRISPAIFAVLAIVFIIGMMLYRR